VHARNPDGSNTMDPAIYGELHQRLCAETDAIVQLTTGGSPTLPVEQRLNTVLLAPEMCSLNLGLLNFFIRGQQVFFSNHRSDIERFAREMRARGVKPELEAYNEAMIEEAEHLIAADLLEPPFILNCVLHTPTQGGLRGTPRNLMGMLERLPANTLVNVSSMGRTQLPITTMALAMGLNVRVGMEDNVYYRRGELVENNARLVERTVRIARELERQPATPDEARAMLGVRGRARGELPAPLMTSNHA
jgi:3-keto-5-aminohexanoate cleavage enzyme